MKNIFALMLKGALAFLVGGILHGWLLLFSEPPLGIMVEAVIGGFIFSMFIKSRYNQVKVVIATTFADVISFFAGAFVGLLFFDAFGVPIIISGALMGLIFGGIIGRLKGALIFAATCLIIFYLGDTLVNSVNNVNGSLYNLVTNILGEDIWLIKVVAAKAVYKGVAIGIGLGIYEKNRTGDSLSGQKL